MNHANSGLAHGTGGSPQLTLDNGNMAAKAKENEAALHNQFERHPIFGDSGHVTLESISARREFFLGQHRTTCN